jgi:hypothetical protein
MAGIGTKVANTEMEIRSRARMETKPGGGLVAEEKTPAKTRRAILRREGEKRAGSRGGGTRRTRTTKPRRTRAAEAMA